MAKKRTTAELIDSAIKSNIDEIFNELDRNQVFIEPVDKRGNDCDKCDGLGYIGAYSHVEDGVCFECKGIDSKTGEKVKLTIF